MDFVRSCFTFALVALLSGVGLVACDQGTAPTNDRSTAVEPLEIEVVEEVEVIIEEEVALVETEVEEEVLWDSGLIVNGSFEEWTSTLHPVGWTWSGGGGERSTDSFSGEYAITFPQVPDLYPMAKQVIDSDLVAGKFVHFGAAFFGEEENKVVIQLRYTNANGESIRRSLGHPGDGQWHEMSSRITIPESHEPGSVEFVLYCTPNTSGKILFDNAFVRIVTD